jgi:hypothetical protein
MDEKNGKDGKDEEDEKNEEDVRLRIVGHSSFLQCQYIISAKIVQIEY